MDKVNDLLTFLDDAGIGNPKKINDVLKGFYTHSGQFDNDHEYFEYAGRIENFLNELRDAKLIKYRIEGFFRVKMGGKYLTLNDCNIMASITYEGSKSLEKGNVNQIVYSANFNGPFSGNFNQGEGNSQQVFNDSKKSEKPKWLTISFYWEELIKYWYKLALGAIGVLLLSWLGFKFLSPNQSSTKENNQEGQIQNGIDSNKERNKKNVYSNANDINDTTDINSNKIYLQSFRPVEISKSSLIVTLNNLIGAVNQEIELKVSDKNTLKTELLKSKKIGDIIKFEKYLITLLSLERNVQTYDLIIKIETK